ncbi:MAG: ATP-binding protein [Cytophagales bacterium]|nr:MAG: ATP-binding protein [Cytophagales bacterium]
MLLEFSITNFKSLKEKQILSLLPSNRIKERINLPFQNLINYAQIEVLKTVCLYGKNNSGKTNTLKSLFALKWLVVNSNKFNAGDEIKANEFFLFDTQMQKQATTFEIDLIAANQIRYQYKVKFTKFEILEEKLAFLPPQKRRFVNLFQREINKPINYSEEFAGKKKHIENDLNKNQLFLSKVANNNPNEHLENVYAFFSKKIKDVNFGSNYEEKLFTQNTTRVMAENSYVSKNIENLLIAADTGIIGLEIAENNPDNFHFPDGISEEVKNKIITDLKHSIKIRHRMFDGENEIGAKNVPIEIESTGTQKIFTLGAILHEAFANGEIVLIDELDKSLHPYLSQMLIKLFYDETLNKNNAQLIFTTHDATLIDESAFAKDQIYIVDKDYYGKTELSAFSDFTGLRKDIPLQKWYLSGRLGGVPIVNQNVHFQFEEANGEE